jgi:hypothetical protein
MWVPREHINLPRSPLSSLLGSVLLSAVLTTQSVSAPCTVQAEPCPFRPAGIRCPCTRSCHITNLRHLVLTYTQGISCAFLAALLLAHSDFPWVGALRILAFLLTHSVFSLSLHSRSTSRYPPFVFPPVLFWHWT